MKRLFDFFLAAGGAFLLALSILSIALLVRLTSSGPAETVRAYPQSAWPASVQ